MKILSLIFENIQNTFYKLENITISSTIRKILFWGVVLASFFLIYVFNILQPIFGDDWGYSMGTEDKHIENFGQILQAQYKHYFSWGGRSVVHVIAQTLLWIGIPWGDFVNSLAYIAFTLVIYYLAKNKEKEYNISLLLIINLLLWLLQPAFAQTFLWITGSANYLWGTLLILLFLIPYKKYALSPSENDSIIKSLLFIPWGIISGWTNENTGIALVFILFCFILYYKIQYKSIPKWALTGLASAFVGIVILIAAPGNYARYEDFGQENSFSIMVLAKQFMGALAGLYYYALPLIFIFTLILAIHCAYGHKKDYKKVLVISGLFFSGAVIAALAMTGSPFFPGRAAFGLNTLIILAIVCLYANLDSKATLIRRISYISISFALLFFVADYFRGYKELKHAHTVLTKRTEKLETLKKQGERFIIFDDENIKVETRFLHYWELPDNPNDWHNRTFSTYHSVDSVIVIQK